MWNGFCSDAIRRTNKNILILVAVLFSLLLLFFAYNRQYFRSFFAGAHTVTASQLENINNPDQLKNTFVRVQGSQTDSTGFSEIIRDDRHPNGYTNSIYLVTDVGHRHLILRCAPEVSEASFPNQIFQGQLLPLTADLRESIVAPAEALNSENGTYLPFYLDTMDYKMFGDTSLVVGGVILFFALLALWFYLRRTGDFNRHPLMRRLAKYGQPEMLVQQIDSEMAGAHTTISKGNMIADITPEWLIASTTFSVLPMNTDRIVWAYRKKLKRKILLFITIRTTYYAIIHDSLGQRISLLLNDAKTTELLQHLRTVAPQAIYGFDKRLWKLWRKSKDKSSFLAEGITLISGQTLGDQETAIRGV